MRRFFFLMLIVLTAACLPEKNGNKADRIVFEKETIRIFDQNLNRQKVEMNVEIADTESKRMRGLMYRTELADNAGMLFLFPTNRKISMWMANTPVSLDMIFIDERGRIQEIAENTVPFSHDVIRSENKAVSVLEIKGGLSKHFNLQLGDIVEHSFFKLEKAK